MNFSVVLAPFGLKNDLGFTRPDFKANKTLFGVLTVNDGETRHYVADYHVLVRILNRIAFLSQL